MDEKLLNIIDSAIGNQLSVNIYDIDETTDLFELGLNSIGFINIIIALEEEYDIFIDQDDLELEQFSKLKNISEFMKQKLETN